MESQQSLDLIQEVQFLRKEVSELRGMILNQESVAKNPTEGLERKISAFLVNVKIPTSITGYVFLREAIKIVCLDFSQIQGVTKVLYPEIAKKFNTTSSKVERAIRHAIELSWFKSNHKFYRQFGSDKPTNSNFIATVSDMIRLEENL